MCTKLADAPEIGGRLTERRMKQANAGRYGEGEQIFGFHVIYRGFQKLWIPRYKPGEPEEPGEPEKSQLEEMGADAADPIVDERGAEWTQTRHKTE